MLAYRYRGGCVGYTLPAPCSPVPDITRVMGRVVFLLSWRQMLGIAPPEVRRGRKRANAIIAGS